MNDIKNFSNLIKYNPEKCSKCMNCVNACESKALTFDDDLKFDIDKCIGCKKCIQSCQNEALCYMVNEWIDLQNQINVVPANVDTANTFVSHAISKFFAEKVRLLNQVFEMIEHTNFLLKENAMDALILFDNNKHYLEQKYIVSNHGSNLVYSHLSKVKGVNYFAQFVEKELSDFEPVINLYGVPFEDKIMLSKIKNVVISDVPYLSYNSFSLYDLVKQYALFSKLEFNYSLEEFNNNDEIILKNKYNVIKIKQVKAANEINQEMIDSYQFIILSQGSESELETDLINDEALNQFYKKLLKDHDEIYLRRQ